MSEYFAPVRDMHFVIKELAGLEQVAELPGYEDASADLVDAVLEEAAKFAGGVLSPLNWPGDQEGARWHDKAAVSYTHLDVYKRQAPGCGPHEPAGRPGGR